MKPKHYDLVDTKLGDHVVFTVQDCAEQIHYVFDENNECKKIVSDRKSLQEPKSVDIYSKALGSFITRPITVEGNDNLFNIPSELPETEGTKPPEDNENTDTSRLIKESTPNTSKLYESSPSTSNKNTTVVPFKFSCCNKQTKVVVCIHCGGAYHRECFNNAGGVLRENDARITCCKEPTNHRVENELRKKIIQEMDEKSEVMRENRELLKAKVASLEKSNFPQNELVKSLVTAMEDKCKILTENKVLLHEKIVHLENRREEPAQNAVSLFQKLISSNIFQQCANLLESDNVRNINHQGNEGLINEIESINSTLPVIESNHTVNENCRNPEVVNKIDNQSPIVNNKPHSASQSDLQQLVTLEKCNDFFKNKLLKDKSLRFKRQKFKPKLSQKHRKKMIFKKKKTNPSHKLMNGLNLINSSKSATTESFSTCDKTNNKESANNVDSSPASANQTLQNINKLPQSQKKSPTQDPPESVPNSKFLSEIKNTSNKSKSTEQDINKNKDINKNSPQMKSTKSHEKSISTKDHNLKGKKYHHKSSQDSVSTNQKTNNPVKDQTLTNKPIKVGKNQLATNISTKLEEIVNSNNKCKKVDKNNQEISKTFAVDTKKIIIENQKSCKTVDTKHNAKTRTENNTLSSPQNNDISQGQSSLQSRKSLLSEATVASLKSSDQLVKEDDFAQQSKKRNEVFNKQKMITKAQQSDAKKKADEAMDLTKNTMFKSTDQSPVIKENINNNGDRLNDVISKIRKKYKAPLKTQIINTAPTKTIVIRKNMIKETLSNDLLINKTQRLLKAVNIKHKNLKNNHFTFIVKKSPSGKKRKTLTYSRDDRELQKSNKLASDMKKFFEEKEKAKKIAVENHATNSSTKTVDQNINNADKSKKLSKENISLKKELSNESLQQEELTNSENKIKNHDENQQKVEKNEALNDGEDIHVDNVNEEDDATSDYPDDDLEESIYVNEEIDEEENDGDARVKEEDSIMDEDTLTETPLDQDSEELSSSTSFFSSIRCKEEESAKTNIDDFECISTLHHEIKLECDDKNPTAKREILSSEVDEEDNKISVSLLVESTDNDEENNSIVASLVKGEESNDVPIDESNSEHIEEDQDVQNNSSFYSPVSESEFLSSEKQNLSKKTSTPMAIKKSQSNQDLHSPTSDVEDAPTGRNSNALFSSTTSNEGERTNAVLKDSTAIRVLNFEDTENLQPNQVKLLQVVNIPNNNNLRKGQSNKSKCTSTMNVDQEVGTNSVSSQENSANDLNAEGRQEENSKNVETCNKIALSHVGESIAGTSKQYVSIVSDQDDNIEISSAPSTSKTSANNKKSPTTAISSIDNSQSLSANTTRFKKPSLCKGKSLPKTSRSSVVVRPYCWTYRTPVAIANRLAEETLPNQESGEQNDGLSTRRYTIQVRRDLTNENVNRAAQSNQEDLHQTTEGFEDPTRRYNIQVRRDLVQRNEDLGEPSGLIQVRRDLIQTNEELNRPAGQIHVRRDLVQSPPQPETPRQLTVRNDLMQSSEHLCERSGHLTLRSDLIQRTGLPSGQLKIRSDFLPNVRESPPKIKVRQDLVQRTDDISEIPGPSTREDGPSQSGRKWGIKVKDLQQLIDSASRPVEEAPETAVPLNLSLQNIGVFPSTSQENQHEEDNVIPIEQVLREETNKKYIKVRKDLGVSVEDLEGSDQPGPSDSDPVNVESSLEPSSKRWSIKVRKDLGQTFDNAEEIGNSNEDAEPILEEENISPDFENNERPPDAEVLQDVPSLHDGESDFLHDINASESNESNRDDKKPEKRFSIKVRTDLVQNSENLNQTPPVKEVEGSSSTVEIIQDLILATETESTNAEVNTPAQEIAQVILDAQGLENPSAELAESPPIVDDQVGVPIVAETADTDSGQRHESDRIVEENNEEGITCENESSILKCNEDAILKEIPSNEEVVKEISDMNNQQDEPEMVNREEVLVNRSSNEETTAKDSEGNDESRHLNEDVINESQIDEAIEESQNDEGISRKSPVNEEFDKDDAILETDEDTNVLNDEIDEERVLNEFQNDEDEILRELEVEEEETLLNKTHIEQEPIANTLKGDNHEEVVKTSNEIAETVSGKIHDDVNNLDANSCKEKSSKTESESGNNNDTIINASDELKSVVDVVGTSTREADVDSEIVGDVSEITNIPSDVTDVRIIPSNVLDDINDCSKQQENEENINAKNDTASVEKNFSEIKSPSSQEVITLLDEEFPKPSTVPVADYIKEYINLCASDGTPNQTGTVEYSNLLESESVVPVNEVKVNTKRPSTDIEEGEIASSSDDVTLVIDESASTSRKRRNRRSRRNKNHDDVEVVNQSSIDQAHFANLKHRSNKTRQENYAVNADSRKKKKRRSKKVAKEMKKRFEMLYDPVDITLGDQVQFQTQSFTEHIECVHDSRKFFRRVTWDKNLLTSRTRLVEIYIDVLEKNITRPITLEGNDNIIEIPSKCDEKGENKTSAERHGRNRKKAKLKVDDIKTETTHLSVNNVNVNANCDNSINQPSSSRSDSASTFDLMDYCFTLRGTKRKSDRDGDDEDSKSPKKLLRKIDVDKFLDMIHKNEPPL